MNVKQTIEDLVQWHSTDCNYLIIDQSSYNFDSFRNPDGIGKHGLERDNQLFLDASQKVLSKNGVHKGKYETKSPVSVWETHLYDCKGIHAILTYAGKNCSSGGNRLQLLSPSTVPIIKLEKLVDKITKALAPLRLKFQFFPRTTDYQAQYRNLNYKALGKEGLTHYEHDGTLKKTEI